ncbi:TetR/AcrR family transcriptional regulator [Saccharopolyspora indica]|uniref:TetR/AcrR family transcriptional regulator n=1 Tax=Saccharopolyspora indica TaxID=1229659 RepID=UPI0022EB8672|nr:TetR/AcrR family transcriptional regulator [Saccharopolyspora indica]MDA3648831.1 TetR/AcrR family transcriptional regulator [Saccharopolyspora indica]
MSVQERKQRERAERHRLIVDSARELLEAEGWDAVTTRRLAERVEYSQPVLYSHFRGKDAILAAVAVNGFAELGVELRRARTGRRSPKAALRAVIDAYLGFAQDRPALYEAMFVRPLDIPFGADDSPAELKEAFAEIIAVLEPLAGDRDVETYAEVVWSAVHGLAVLARGDRLRASHREARLDLLIDSVA